MIDYKWKLIRICLSSRFLSKAAQVLVGIASGDGDLHLWALVTDNNTSTAGLERAHFGRSLGRIRRHSQLLEDPLILLHDNRPMDGIRNNTQILSTLQFGATVELTAQGRVVFIPYRRK